MTALSLSLTRPDLCKLAVLSMSLLGPRVGTQGLAE